MLHTFLQAPLELRSTLTVITYTHTTYLWNPLTCECSPGLPAGALTVLPTSTCCWSPLTPSVCMSSLPVTTEVRLVTERLPLGFRWMWTFFLFSFLFFIYFFFAPTLSGSSSSSKPVPLASRGSHWQFCGFTCQAEKKEEEKKKPSRTSPTRLQTVSPSGYGSSSSHTRGVYWVRELFLKIWTERAQPNTKLTTEYFEWGLIYLFCPFWTLLQREKNRSGPPISASPLGVVSLGGIRRH